MFQYALAFLLINSYYQSLGTPIQTISKSLDELAHQCENALLSKAIQGKLKDCAVFAPPYSKKQIRCLTFYDINKQLCAAVATSKLAISDDFGAKISEKQDVFTVCTAARDWILLNLTEFDGYKNASEKLLKSPFTCGEICGVEDEINEANEYCKYYKWGLEMLRNQVATTANNENNNVEEAPVIDPDSNGKGDIAVPINSISLNAQVGSTKTQLEQIKQTESAAVATNTVPEKTAGSADAAVPKSSTAQTTSVKQTPKQENVEAEKNDNVDVNAVEEQMNLPESNDQANKSLITHESKPEVENDPALLPESGKGVPLDGEQKEIPLDETKGKPLSGGDPDEYVESEGNDGDEEGDDQGLDVPPKQETKQKNSFTRKQSITIEGAQRVSDIYPNSMSDGFSDDGDHFFPFFLTAVIMVVLLYVLYHNKSKFFGLILEGRQGSRRRNSRGHAYRRLDTLEQAMSANTAAPPSKIIY
ncbi:uncharacterized protein LOC142976424 isoform X2 [Anticarsia gemmatalis]|uniref:uncharacterized protein LOC142976424 isoform X2 n=1 Tax=Anticarsia gemmatalis TaxID=129554 RepID=UPI003F775D45